MTTKVFGDFVQQLSPEDESLEIVFISAAERVKSCWRNQRLTARFVADYFANLLSESSAHSEVATQSIETAKHAISYVVSELLENAVKFHFANAEVPIQLGVHLCNPSREAIALVWVTNCSDKAQATNFQTFIQNLLASNPNELYVQQIEASAMDNTSEGSGLGLLTMLNDYQAKLGWKFEPLSNQPNLLTITTMVQVPI